MELTQKEIERYAPYHMWPEFETGYREYGLPAWPRTEYGSTVAGQAYDRGAECAMRRRQAEIRNAAEAASDVWGINR
jgi:hypothetical protein